MAIVPFCPSGPAADQGADVRIIQIGPYTLHLQQDSAGSGSSRMQPDCGDSGAMDAAAERGCEAGCSGGDGTRLQNVGRIVWQSGIMLAEYLVRKPPFGEWGGVRVLDLGAGTGVVGIALALAGANVTMTDLPHITPLTRHNASQNLSRAGHCQVVDGAWGDSTEVLGCWPDVITGADLIYAADSQEALLQTLKGCCSTHTVVFLSFRIRGAADMSFGRKMEQQGFLVSEVDQDQVGEDFRGQALCRAAAGAQALLGCYSILVAELLA